MPSSALKHRCLIGALSAVFAAGGVIEAGKLEEAYSKYTQGRYEEARKDVADILDAKPAPEEAAKMQADVGVRAFLEMAQNEYLSREIRLLGAVAWQYERNQFKNPRRIQYHLQAYLEDKSVRGKALMNLVAAGEYALPPLIEQLGSKQPDVAKRGLSYQALLRIGREAVPGMVASTYAEDPILLVNLIRLFGELKDPRALPYLVRLQEKSRDANVRQEIARVLPLFPDAGATTSGILLIAEANRYIREDKAAVVEALSSDGLIFEWNAEKKVLEAVNLIGQETEFLPRLPPNLWPLFRAEMIHYEINKDNLAQQEALWARASLLACWAAQENRAGELLDPQAVVRLGNVAEPLKEFLKRRELEVEVAQWGGSDTLLASIDMAAKEFDPFVASRLLQIATEYHPAALLTTKIISFVDGGETNPAIESLYNPNEMVRYWAAIAAGRADPSLSHESQPLIVDLLTQAVDEVAIDSVLLVAEPSMAAENIKKGLKDVGFSVYQVDSGFDGINALREFPSKDFVIVSDKLSKNLSTLEFVTRLRKDFKGRDVPLAILTDEKSKPAVLAAFQDHAQQILLEVDAGEVLKDRMAKMAQHRRKEVFAKQVVNQVSREALVTLKGLDDKVLRSYPVLVNHLADLVANPFHTREHEILAIQVLRKFSDLAFAATPVLLDKLFDEGTDHEYKLELLATMRDTSRSHPKVREALYALTGDHKVDRRIRIQAASYLGLDADQSPEVEKRKFQGPFFTRQFPRKEPASGM